MTSALQNLHKFTHLRVVLQSDIFDTGYLATTDSSKFVGSVRGSAFDFSAIAISLVCSLLSLRFVFLTTRGDDARFDRDIDPLVLGGK